MKSAIIKRSVVINGHRTSVSLEDLFWNQLKEIAHIQRVTLSQVVAGIDTARAREHKNLSSAIRLFVLNQVSSARAMGAGQTRPNGVGSKLGYPAP